MVPPALSNVQWQEAGQSIAAALANHGLIRIPVRGNGHCMMSSVSFAMASSGIAAFDTPHAVRAIFEEVSRNREFYEAFIVGDLKLQLSQYLHPDNRDYNSETADMIINILSNAYGIGISIVAENPDGTASLLQQLPRIPLPRKQ